MPQSPLTMTWDREPEVKQGLLFRRSLGEIHMQVNITKRRRKKGKGRGREEREPARLPLKHLCGTCQMIDILKCVEGIVTSLAVRQEMETTYVVKVTYQELDSNLCLSGPKARALSLLCVVFIKSLSSQMCLPGQSFLLAHPYVTLLPLSVSQVYKDLPLHCLAWLLSAQFLEVVFCSFLKARILY